MEAGAESLNLSMVIPVRLLRAERKTNMVLTMSQDFLYRTDPKLGVTYVQKWLLLLSGAIWVIQKIPMYSSSVTELSPTYNNHYQFKYTLY